MISYVLRYWVSYTHNVNTVYLQRYKIYFFFLVTKEYRYRKSMTTRIIRLVESFLFVIWKGVKKRYSRAPEGASQLRVTIGLRENRKGLPVYQATTIFFSQLDIFRKFGGGTNRRLRRVDREDRRSNGRTRRYARLVRKVNSRFRKFSKLYARRRGACLRINCLCMQPLSSYPSFPSRLRSLFSCVQPTPKINSRRCPGPDNERYRCHVSASRLIANLNAFTGPIRGVDSTDPSSCRGSVRLSTLSMSWLSR